MSRAAAADLLVDVGFGDRTPPEDVPCVQHEKDAPTFDQLLRGSKTYLAVTSLLGLMALIDGVLMLVEASEAALAVVMVAMVAMWLIATTHHSLVAQTTVPKPAQGVGETVRPKVTI